MDWQTASKELAKPLDQALVSTLPKQGQRPAVDYLSDRHVIDQANRLFGYEGWSIETTVEQTAVMGRIETTNREVREAAIAYRAQVKVVVGLVVRVGDGFARVAEVGSALSEEMAYRAAATDAMKRAFRTFGPQFGNDLWVEWSMA